MSKIAALLTIGFSLLCFASGARAQQILMGYSGAGISTDLRRVIEKEKLWEKYGLNVKSIYFNSGGLLTQAMASGSIHISDSDVPAMLGLSVSGVLDIKTISVTFNKLEHFFVRSQKHRAPGRPQGQAGHSEPDRIRLRCRDPNGAQAIQDRPREGSYHSAIG